MNDFLRVETLVKDYPSGESTLRVLKGITVPPTSHDDVWLRHAASSLTGTPGIPTTVHGPVHNCV